MEIEDKLLHLEKVLFTIGFTSKNPSQNFCEDARIYKRMALRALIDMESKHSNLAKETLEIWGKEE